MHTRKFACNTRAKWFVCLVRHSTRDYGAQSQLSRNLLYTRDKHIPYVLSQSIQSNYLSENNPMAMFIDLSHFRDRCNELKTSFNNAGINNDNITHTFAVKALPLPKIIKEANLLGFGAECASKGEIDISVQKGNIPNNKIVFDSPCKTISELEYCLTNNISFNIDNFQELDRVATILSKNNNNNNIYDNIYNNIYDSYVSEVGSAGCNIGIRVNPVVGLGSIDVTSTASADCKLGTNIEQFRDELYCVYNKHAWLNTIHCHIGSQGCSIDQIVDGIKKIVEFTESVNCNSLYNNQIKYIDIGGGLPINYESEEIKPRFVDFVRKMKQKIPILFENKYHIITEFGRSLIQKSGWIASRVEYTKTSGNKNVAIIHAGANLFVRTAYLPHVWKHHITVHHSDGSPKVPEMSGTCKYDIAGPLCFNSDYVARDIELPYIEPGDYVVIHDTGGYTYGMYSRYNSRCAPAIYGYDTESMVQLGNGNNKIQHYGIEILKKSETSQDIIDFWHD